MKTLGLIGGMSWESTIPYYRHINELVRQRLGGHHSARLVLYSVDFHAIEQMQRAGEWERAAEVLIDAARAVTVAGADLLLLCTNTMHKVAPTIEASVAIPFLHIADATAREILGTGIRTVGLLGTRFTMDEDFYRQRLESYGLRIIVPEAADRDDVHRVIYDELCQGIVRDSSREVHRGIMRRLVAGGAEGIVLACTELAMLIQPSDAEVPVFDTTRIHASHAVDWALRS